MAGRPWRFLLCGLVCLAVARGRSCVAEDKAAAPVTVQEMQAGGFVFDKGTRLVKDSRLKLSIIPLFETFRTQAPLNVSVRLQWGGPGLLEGRVLCDLYAYERYIGSWKSQELAVNDQVLSFPLMLPPSPLYNDRDPFNLRIAFETADRTILLDQRDLPIESAWSRNFVVGVVAPSSVSRIGGFKSNEQAPQMADLFQVANFHDFPQHAAQFVTNTTPVDTRELPVDPMRLTAFDLVVVSPESLRELRPAQWQALATWIRGGGRACIVATMAVPENLRASWRELFNERPDGPLMTFNENGRPEFASHETRLRVRAGNGRILCLNDTASVDGPDWTGDVLWLLGVREGARSSILKRGKWSIGLPPANPAAQVTFHPLVPVVRPIAEMRRPLNSPQVGKVSPWMIVLLLGTCLLLIGPVDYYVLGRFGLRRLTWVFLPCVSIATTWATMRVSQSALGGKDYARAISVADLDAVGRVTRVSRFEQHYAGREGVHQRDKTSAYRIDFERPLFGWNSSSNPLVPWDGVRGGDDRSNQPPLRYQGKVTGGYELFEPMFQWSPRLFRETTFGDDPRINSKSLAGINWSKLENISWATVDGRREIRDLVRAVLPEAQVYVRFALETVDCSLTEEAKLSQPDPIRFAVPTPREEQAGGGADGESAEAFVRLIGKATSCPRTYNEGGNRWQQSVQRPFGLFGLLRERSPTCGADLEDLQWIDSEDPMEAVLMILVKGEETVIYRRRLALAAEAR